MQSKLRKAKIRRRKMGKTTRETMGILGVSELTLRMWVIKGKIKPIVYRIGKRNFNDFPEEEIYRVKKLMNKRWKQGKAKLSE